MISLEALPKIIDTSQLTTDLEGTLSYDHASWLETRLSVEDFSWQAADLLDRLDDLQEDLARSDFADDVSGAKHKIDLHNEMKKKIMKAPVEDIDLLGKHLCSISFSILIAPRNVPSFVRRGFPFGSPIKLRYVLFQINLWI